MMQNKPVLKLDSDDWVPGQGKFYWKLYFTHLKIKELHFITLFSSFYAPAVVVVREAGEGATVIVDWSKPFSQAHACAAILPKYSPHCGSNGKNQL